MALTSLFGQGRPGLALARGVADQAGEVADEKDHLVPQVLEMLELLDEHGVAQVQVRRGGVEPGLDPQGLAGGDGLLQARLQFLFPNDVMTALLDQGQLFRYGFHEV